MLQDQTGEIGAATLSNEGTGVSGQAPQSFFLRQGTVVFRHVRTTPLRPDRRDQEDNRASTHTKLCRCVCALPTHGRGEAWPKGKKSPGASVPRSHGHHRHPVTLFPTSPSLTFVLVSFHCGNGLLDGAGGGNGSSKLGNCTTMQRVSENIAPR